MVAIYDEDKLDLANRVIQKVAAHPEGSGLVMKLNLAFYQYGSILPESDTPLAKKLFENTYQSYFDVKTFVEKHNPKVAGALVYEKDFIDALALHLTERS